MFIIVKSFYFSYNFGLALIFLLFTSALLSPILCQTKKTAIISNITQVGKLDQNTFNQLISMLNSEDNLNVVIIIGELTKSGSLEEFNSIHSSLVNLKTLYQVIGGYNDYSGIPKYFLNFNQVFENDEFILSDNNKILLGINSVNPNCSAIAFIKVESINKIIDETGVIKSNQVYLFANNSLSRTQNSKYLLNLLKDKYIFSFYPTEKTFTAQLNPAINVTEVGIPSFRNSDALNYFLLEELADTFRIVRKSSKNNLSEILYAVSLNDINKSVVSIEESIADSSITKTFELEYKTSTTSKNIVSDNRIYTILDNGLIYLNDLSGKEKFITELIGRIESNPVLYKDLLLAATVEGDLYSINSNNGEVLQVVGIGENITSDISLIDITGANTKSIGVVLGTSEGNIFCYDAYTFELLWEKNISKSPIISTPAVQNDKVVFFNSNSSLYCVNVKSGSLNWKYEFSDEQNFSPKNYPLCDGKNIFSISSDGNLFAIDLLLGKKTWSLNTKGVLNQFYITADKQKLLLLDSRGLMTIYSAKDGKEIINIDFKKSALFSFNIAENQENTFVGFSDGSLYTFDTKFIVRQLISPTQIPITSINVINKDEFLIKDINGMITFYKIN